MKRLFLIATLFLCFAFAYKGISKITSLESEKISDLPLNWQAKIGNVSFRTNVEFLNGNLIIGSNGGNYMDYFIDKGNGVYVIDPVSGKIKQNFSNESFGDMDVNGVLVHNNRIFYGNDNDEIICADQSGKIIFRQEASGDIEHRPILIKTGNSEHIVFAMETGEVRAINPADGKILWSYFHPEFEGYKPDDSRIAFKIKMHAYSGEMFFMEPVVKDLNGDGVDDLMYVANETDVFIINGKNGGLICRIQNEYGSNYYGNFHVNLYRNNAALIEEKGEKFIMIPFNKFFENDPKGEKSISQLRFFNLSGKEVNRINISNDTRVDRMEQRGNLVFFANRWLDFSEGIENYKSYKYDAEMVSWNPPRVGEKSITINGDECLILSFEHGIQKINDKLEEYNTSIGIYNLRTKSFEKLHHFTTTSEFIPMLGDFNKDNKADLLIGCHDGTLYNFDLGYDVKNINH